MPIELGNAKMTICEWSKLNSDDRYRVLQRPICVTADVSEMVEMIVKEVCRKGDTALLSYTRELDLVELQSLAVTDKELSQADADLTKSQRHAITAAADNIERFHQVQVPERTVIDTVPGVRCERVTRPIESVGLYVPGGHTPLPSTALMLAIPAALAGCPTKVLCSPPNRNGKIAAAVLFVAKRYGIRLIFKVGGAQAIAAMAYGTQTIPKVNKIFGPGNSWVTAAKAYVSRDPTGAAQDLPAGPSELLVIADVDANPAFVAADLLSQAEHGKDSQVMLVTNCKNLAAAVASQIAAQKVNLTRQEIVDEVLLNSSTLVVEDLGVAVDIANRYAPEHLILQTQSPRDLLDKVTTAGSVFLGPWAPEAVGDYCSGTNHVLPTNGLARAYSGLGLNDFLRTMTLQELKPEGIAALGPLAQTLAKLEGLDAHEAAVAQRLKVLREKGLSQ